MSVDEGATIWVRSLSPFGERVGVRGIQNDRETLTPHPTPLPAEVGFIRLRPLQMPNSGKPEFGGRGSRPSSAPALIPSRRNPLQHSRLAIPYFTRHHHALRTIAGTNCLIDGAPTCCIMA